ncbi:hypothetical protein THAOC_23609, partial [Thalassiosira oceanica]
MADNRWKRVVIAVIATAASHHDADAAVLRRRRRDHSGYLRGGMSSSSHQTHSRGSWPSSYHYRHQDSGGKDLPANSHGPIDDTPGEPTTRPSAPPTQLPTTSSPMQDSESD